MISSPITAIAAYGIWLVLTAGPGTIGLGSAFELTTGAVLAAVSGAMACSFFYRFAGWIWRTAE